MNNKSNKQEQAKVKERDIDRANKMQSLKDEYDDVSDPENE